MKPVIPVSNAALRKSQSPPSDHQRINKYDILETAGFMIYVFIEVWADLVPTMKTQRTAQPWKYKQSYWGSSADITDFIYLISDISTYI